MSENQEKIYDTLIGLDSKKVVQLFMDYCGSQLLDDRFYEFLIDEGVIEDDED